LSGADLNTLIALRLAAEGKVRLERFDIFSTATSGGITARPNELQRHFTNLRETVSTA
jgi:hypothetical protein